MKNRSVATQVFAGLLLTVVTLALTACGQNLYPVPEFNFAGRPIPPSLLLQRVLATFTSGGATGGAVILDGNRDLRGNVQNTIPSFPISGYSGGNPSQIINYPEQSTGYIFDSNSGRLTAINYGKEATAGDVATFSPTTPSVAVAVDGARFIAAQAGSGQLVISGATGSFALNLPNIDKVVVNPGDSVIFAMVRNSDALYRVVKLNATNMPFYPPGYVDCQPILLPVYCVVPVPGKYDRPTDVNFSLDGNTAYVLNCGPECGGKTAGITFLQAGALTVDVIPTINPLDPSAPTPLSPVPTNPLPVPGGVTETLSDGTTLYIAGQQLQPDGFFAGKLTTMNLASYALSTPISISDGHHSKLLFADDNTLWVGAQQCANGERQHTGQNYNCLTRVALGASPTATIVPAVTLGSPTQVVQYPNTNQDLYYYGSLTGLCWVQGLHKVYTAYGGQIHAFNTATSAEINNFNITIQGTVLDVAYMDAVTNRDN